MAYNSKDWDVVRSFYERGLSLADIVARDEVVIRDRSSISKKAKAEGWIKGVNSTLVENEVLAKQAIADIASKKSTMNSTELDVHNTIVDERLKHTIFFNNSAIRNVKEAMDLECGSQFEFKARAETILKGREAVLGKTADTAIQINNNITGKISADEMTDDQLAAIAAGRSF